MLYRKEIDGIRALAVIPVVLFHAGLDGFGGGYVGVDVFFVISGYLITSIILDELEQGNFKLLAFYERRARRILPALIFIILLCIPFAWQWMMPHQLRDFFQSISATAVFASNFLFWIEDGYFAVAAEQKPLLHTWSLAVEEQFYLFFPLTLLFLWRFLKSGLTIVICIIILVSLALSEYWDSIATNIFYLTHIRIWELLLGTVLTIVLRKHPAIGGYTAEIASGLGLFCVVVSIVAYDRSTPYPSIYTILPTAGTLLLIAFATSETFVGRLMSTKFLVGIGLISYSFYLWHQPIFAFARLRSPKELDPSLVGALVFVALILAYFTWKFVEQPFRNRDRFSRRHIFLFASGASLLIFGLGVAGHIGKGFSFRLSEEQLAQYQILRNATVKFDVDDGACKFSSETIDAGFEKRFTDCLEKFDKPVFVFGDSHAEDLFNALALVSKNQFVVGMTPRGCRIHTPEDTALKRNCDFGGIGTFINKYSKVLSAVIYTQKGSYFLHENKSPPIVESHAKVVKDYLQGLEEGPLLIWVGPQSEPNIDLRNLNTLFSSIEPEDAAKENLHIYDVDRYLKSISNDSVFEYVSKIDSIQYDFEKDYIVDGQFTYADTDHWSSFGERYYGAKLLNNPVLAQVLINPAIH